MGIQNPTPASTDEAIIRAARDPHAPAWAMYATHDEDTTLYQGEKSSTPAGEDTITHQLSSEGGEVRAFLTLDVSEDEHTAEQIRDLIDGLTRVADQLDELNA